MRFNLISNVSNGVGLQADCELLSQELRRRGHEVALLQFDREQRQAADVNVFLEVVVDSMFRLAPQNWLVPNPEWHYPHWPLGSFRYVLAKTHDAQRIFSEKVNGHCRYIGWRARDLYRPDVKRERKFLHVAGKSQFKNTDAVIRGCELAGVPVTVVSQQRGRLRDDEMVELFNSHRFFLCPSAAEGWGQALHEALGCGAVVITTDAAPMNEIEPSLLIRPIAQRPHNLGVLHTVAPGDVAYAVHTAINMRDEELAGWRERGRTAFENETRQFSSALDAVLVEA